MQAKELIDKMLLEFIFTHWVNQILFHELLMQFFK
jgi:hypothetical protein